VVGDWFNGNSYRRFHWGKTPANCKKLGLAGQQAPTRLRKR
jgi:hypothetical protein